MGTFTHEVKFFSKVAKDATWIDEEVTKTATFEELNRSERKQHKLHFAAKGLFLSSVKDANTVSIDWDALYDLTLKYIDTCMVITPEFSEVDKSFLLNDSNALFALGNWVLSDKLLPFFQPSPKSAEG